jgi:hypothetical protein
MNKETAKAMKSLSQLSADRAKQKLIIPESPKVERRLSLGSLGMTLTPPYTWPWTWSGTSGSPSPPLVHADQKSGRMSFNLFIVDNGGAASAAAAVGIYFRPFIQDIGILQITANPAFSYNWWTYNTFDSSHSDGWIGTFIGEYTPNGTQYSHIDQEITLWNESHDFLTDADNSASNSVYPLSAALFVNGQSFYEIWVWCGGSFSADGDHTFYGSYAGSILSVSVPFIHLELWG